METTGWPKPETWLRPIQDAGYAPLTAKEARILDDAGMVLSPLPQGMLGPLEESRRDFLELVTSGSSSVAEVAYNLNRPQATITSWIDERRLFAIWHEGTWRIPKFQFAKGGNSLIPCIASVNRKLPTDWHPLTIERWYRLPNLDLEDEYGTLSPLEWLLFRQDALPLLQIAELLECPQR